MREDMRHKHWMLALSCLGNFLFIPVAWLIDRNNMSINFDKYTMTTDRMMRYLINAYEFYGEYLMLLAGCIALAGALIVGLFGFRYVFHKNMVDTWHSLPIKRTTLFGACWLNGFLIWFVPFFLAMFLSVLMSGGYVLEVCSYGAVSGMAALGTVCKEALLTMLTLIVAFLLVYNTVLFAVMLSGNVLNTLVSLVIIGFSVIGIYGLDVLNFSLYMETFYDGNLKWNNVVYASPLFSSGCLLWARAEYFLEEPLDRIWQFWPCLMINFAIAAGLGIGAWYLYQKRSSELAEQGIKNKLLIALMKLAMGMVGGICGWLLFVALCGNNYNQIWGSFGCILVSVLVFGILDIIFHMDFKAFFRHKIQMVVTTLLALLLCFAFRGDWFGYDKYLPDKEDIAYIAVYDNNFANRYFYNSTEVLPLREMQYDKVDEIYAFLERMVGITEGASDEYKQSYNNDRMTVKVTLKNGKTYYRYYYYNSKDKDVLWPILTSEEYLLHTYLFDEEDINGTYEYYIERYNDQHWVESKEIDKDKVRMLMEAYNRDLLANPDTILLGEGKGLAQLNFQVEDSTGDRYEIYMDIYSGMTNTIRAMEEAGYGQWVEEIDAADVTSIQLYLGCFPDVNTTPEQMIALARDYYGYITEDDRKTNQELAEAYEIVVAEVANEPCLTITDKKEIAEILEYCSYRNGFRTNVFSKGHVRITYTSKDGMDSRLYLKDGALPEKFILRFGEIDLETLGKSEYYEYYEYYK